MKTPALHIQLQIQIQGMRYRYNNRRNCCGRLHRSRCEPYSILSTRLLLLIFFFAFLWCVCILLWLWTTFIHKQILMKWKLCIRKMFMFFLFRDFLQQAKKLVIVFDYVVLPSLFLFFVFWAALLVGASLATVNEPCSSNPISELQYVYLIYAIFYFI